MDGENPSEGPRKSLPSVDVTAKAMRMEIDPIYSDEKLDYNTIRNNPVLKPLAEINNGHVNMELLINKALWDYQETKAQIDQMIEINPKYSETIITTKFSNLLNYTKQIIQAQDIQKDNMKRAINEMIKIVGQEYGVINDEDVIITKEVKPKTTTEPIPEDTTAEEPKEPQVFHSELLEKDIPLLPNQKKQDFLPSLMDKEEKTN